MSTFNFLFGEITTQQVIWALARSLIHVVRRGLAVVVGATQNRLRYAMCDMRCAVTLISCFSAFVVLPSASQKSLFADGNNEGEVVSGDVELETAPFKKKLGNNPVPKNPDEQPSMHALVWPVVRAGHDTKLKQADSACKLRMGTLETSERYSHAGTLCKSTCEVISPLKGDLPDQIQIEFRRNGNGLVRPGDRIESGGVYLVLLKGNTAPYRIFSAMRAIEQKVEPVLGTKPVDRLMAEMIAMYKTSDSALVNSAVKQIGMLRDMRGQEPVNAAAKSRNDLTARTAIIAQYRMGIAPDADRTMQLFDPWMQPVWYSEGFVRDFDYATYIREGIKKDWVRKDDHSLYSFFGAIWKIKRKECVPELIKLLDHVDQRIRYWGAVCLARTVDNKDSWGWEKYQQNEARLLLKWRTWWEQQGAAFMAGGDG